MSKYITLQRPTNKPMYIQALLLRYILNQGNSVIKHSEKQRDVIGNQGGKGG